MPPKKAPAKKAPAKKAPAKEPASKPIKKEPKATKASQKAKIDKNMASSSSIHYILMLDDSGSMSGKPWQDLKSACKDFLESLTKSKNSGDRISCIIYNSYSKTVFENQVPSNSLNDKIVMVSGGTAYAPALKMAKDISGKTE